MVNDLLVTTRANLDALGLANADVSAIRAAGQAVAPFPNRCARKSGCSKRFMYANLYHHPLQLAAASGRRIIVADLYEAYLADPALMETAWTPACAAQEPYPAGISRTISPA